MTTADDEVQRDGIAFAEAIRENTLAAQRRDREATVFYQALIRTGRLQSHVRLTYRCSRERRCAVLHVLQTPTGWIFGFRHYKRSPAQNAATSTESARKKRTWDGDRHWDVSGHFSGDVGNCPINCDHMNSKIEVDRIEGDLAAGLTEVFLT